MTSERIPRLPLILPLILAVSLPVGGCVQRRMTIRSNPPGAQVYVDNHEIGRTPVSTDFLYYGKRKIRLVKDGYETLTIDQAVRPPWYQLPGLDFVVENLSPWEVRDERLFDYQMQPQLVVPSETLLSRAEELRRGNQVIPAAPSTSAPATIGLPGQPTPTPYAPPPATLNYPPTATPGYSDSPNAYGGVPIAPLP